MPKAPPGSALGRLEPSNLRTRAWTAIRASIITGELQAGEIYPVAYFASRLGVSATPVREALLDLAGEGLMQVMPNRGFRILELSEHDLDEIFQLRLLLEVPSVGQVSGRLTAVQVQHCKTLARQIEECAASGDLPEFLKLDRAFHCALIEPLGNERLLTMINRLRDQARLLALPALARSEQLVASSGEHSEMLDAVARGDGEAARTLIKRHLEHTRGLWAEGA